MTAKRRWKQPAKRMEAAVRMRAAGWSLRKIADHLGVNHETVRRDLTRWEQDNVDQLLSHLGVASVPGSDADATANATPNATGEEWS